MRFCKDKHITLFLDDALEQPEDVWRALNNPKVNVVIPYPVLAACATRPRMSLKEAQSKGLILNHGYNHDSFAKMSAFDQIIDVLKASIWLKRYGIKSYKIFVAPQSSIKLLTSLVLSLLKYKIFVGQSRKLFCTSRFPIYGRTLNDTVDVVGMIKEGETCFYTHDIGLMSSKFGCTKDVLDSFIKTIEDYESLHL